MDPLWKGLAPGMGFVYGVNRNKTNALSQVEVIHVHAFDAAVGDRVTASREEFFLHPLSKTDAFFVQ